MPVRAQMVAANKAAAVSRRQVRTDGIPQRMVRSNLMDRIVKSGKLGMWARAIEASMSMSMNEAVGGVVDRTAQVDQI
ncbi:hypothetical protein [Croceicoccus estronivorus]|uniref:hypothetical protein n=1 Tax=Croceicoccus estronivorus TaxID=1172626 RepID=UPI000B0540B8|nr:hypothetical protein [Croceicoccus estronivorus]